jgi:hypothetical protein
MDNDDCWAVHLNIIEAILKSSIAELKNAI